MALLHHDLLHDGPVLLFQHFPDYRYFVVYCLLKSCELLVSQLFLIHQNNVKLYRDQKQQKLKLSPLRSHLRQPKHQHHTCMLSRSFVSNKSFQRQLQMVKKVDKHWDIGLEKMIFEKRIGSNVVNEIRCFFKIYTILLDSITMRYAIVGLLLLAWVTLPCDPCYSEGENNNCRQDEVGKESYTLHMTVHPHLDAFWIFDFESYYAPKPNQGDVWGYFASNRFTPVRDIFSIAKDVLWESKTLRQTVSNRTQKAHRSFMNSEMGFFKRWYVQQNPTERNKVKEILKTKYWQILGGGYVEQDEGCAYYDDIIENFELGLHFLKEQFGYYPRAAVAADSFGHSQSSLAILAHLGIQGYFVERSDEHILLQNKTEFIWRAKSANGRYYGALPTHIRWAIHGFEDQFIGNNPNEDMCQSKQSYMRNLRSENQFLKRILKSNHIMRYFGHDFQKFDNYSYTVIESMMKKFSMEKCNKVVALYGNPTEYFMTLMGEVFGKKVKPTATRSEDIFPIWDYDSGLYWTGYFTTDAYHKKDYRDLGRLLRGVRKVFINMYANEPNSDKNKKYYQLLEEVAEQVSYLQHHDGISGTSKYTVMDKLELQNQYLYKNVTGSILKDAFADQFPIGTNAPLFECHIGHSCKIPSSNKGDIYLKIINTDGSPVRDPIIIEVPIGHNYLPDCQHELNCFCYEQVCPCKLYLYKLLYTFTSIKLKKVDSVIEPKVNRLKPFLPTEQYQHSTSHFSIVLNGKTYSLGYKKVIARATPRYYDHLSRYGQQYSRSFNIRPGKYALGNDPKSTEDFSQIKKVSQLESNKMLFFLIEWKRYQMKTLISIPKDKQNQWTVQTITATEGYHLQDLYFEVITPINNLNQFVTDSNGWLTVKRELFKHQDYQAHFSRDKYDDLDGNSYPATAFAYIQDENDKVSINIERPQGVVAYVPGTLWVNFDRLSEDDGKWVYQSAYRSEYQKYTHTITVQNKDHNERKIQRQYDQPLFIQGNLFSANQRVEDTEIDISKRNQWNSISNLDSLKFSIRPFNDSTTILRVHNLNDSDTVTVGLYAGKISPLLTTYYARTVTFDNISEASLGGNMPYSKFISDKWNWNEVIDLQEDNSIFNKQFKENITLRPLEIRTFTLTNLRFAESCIDIKDLKYNNVGISYVLDLNKPAPKRDPIAIQLEQEVIKYNQNADHCDGKSPILDTSNLPPIASEQKKPSSEPKFEAKPVEATPVNAHNDAVAPPPSPYTPQQTHSLDRPAIPTEIPHQSTSNTNKVSSLTAQQIHENVRSLKVLTKSQKQYYFTAKLTEIRKRKHKGNS